MLGLSTAIPIEPFNPAVRTQHAGQSFPVKACDERWCVLQVTALSIECGALWHCVHGSLAAQGSVAAAALDAELVVFSWLRLQRTVADLLGDLPAHVASSAGRYNLHNRLPAHTRSSSLCHGLVLDGVQPVQALPTDEVRPRHGHSDAGQCV